MNSPSSLPLILLVYLQGEHSQSHIRSPLHVYSYKNLVFLKCAGNFATTSGKAGSGWIFVTCLQITHYLLTIRLDFAVRRLMCLGGYICIICVIYSTYVTYIHIGGMLSVTNCDKHSGSLHSGRHKHGRGCVLRSYYDRAPR